MMERNPSDRVRRVFREDPEDRLIAHLGRPYVEYRKAWTSAGPDAVPRFLIHLDLEWYDNCNQRCVFCPRNTEIHPNPLYPINTGHRLDSETIDRIVEEAADQDLQSVNFGAFAEPLLSPGLPELIRRFHDAGVVDSRIISNGLLLHKHAEALLESGLVNLFISLDAFHEETYQAQRGPGFKKIKQNLLDFLDLKRRTNAVLPIVRVSFVVTDDNRDELDDFVEFWIDRVDFIDVQSKTDYRTSALDQERPRTFNCLDPFRRVAIIGNGDILPCCTFWGRTLPIGNVTKNSIADAWAGDAMGTVRERLLADRSNVCISCQSA